MNSIEASGSAVRLSVSQVRSELAREIEDVSGQKVAVCNQCGKCSAGCPAVFAMDLLPNQVIRYLQLGLSDVLTAKSIWLCASCQACLSRCPKGVDLPRVMEALRAVLLRRGADHMALTDVPPETVAEMPQQALVSGWRKFSS